MEWQQSSNFLGNLTEITKKLPGSLGMTHKKCELLAKCAARPDKSQSNQTAN
jgi:hypothetical protein